MLGNEYLAVTFLDTENQLRVKNYYYTKGSTVWGKLFRRISPFDSEMMYNLFMDNIKNGCILVFQGLQITVFRGQTAEEAFLDQNWKIEKKRHQVKDNRSNANDADNYSNYSKYGGVHGLDDDTIDSAFEGDPENYWNID